MRWRSVVSWGALALAGCGAPAPRPNVAPPVAPAKSPPPARCVDMASCARSCDEGALGDCERWYEDARTRPLGVDVGVALARLERACEAGHGIACEDAATILGQSPVLTPDPARAEAFMQKACEARRPTACLSAYKEITSSSATPTAEARAAIEQAITEASKRCDEHDGAGCAVASVLVLSLEHDPVRARRFMNMAGAELETGCLSGKAIDCVRGAAQAMASDVPQPSRARRLFERGCSLGAPQACTGAAKLTEGTPRERGARFAASCEAGDAEGCLELADLGAGSGQDPARAAARGLAIARDGCRLGEEPACELVTRALEKGAGAGAEAKAALALVEASCERGEGVLCHGVSKLLASGPEALRDAAAAKRFEERSCELGYPFACRDWRALLGLYPKLEVPLYDARSRLEWAPVSAGLVSLAEGEALCTRARTPDRDLRLPTRVELSTLVDAEGLLPFASATSGAEGALLSSDVGPDGRPFSLDVRLGKERHEGRGIARCVRKVDRDPPRADRLVLTTSGDDVAYTLTSRAGKVLLSRTQPTDREGWERSPFVWDGANYRGPADVEVSPGVPWDVALQIVALAQHDGLAVRRVVVLAAKR